MSKEKESNKRFIVRSLAVEAKNQCRAQWCERKGGTLYYFLKVRGKEQSKRRYGLLIHMIVINKTLLWKGLPFTLRKCESCACMFKWTPADKIKSPRNSGTCTEEQT